MKVAIGSDHAGLELKAEIKKYLEDTRGFEMVDYGPYEPGAVSYAEYGAKVGRAVASGECECGICICGTGIGISLAANKIKGIRAAVCSEPFSARMTKRHNNANIIAFGARVVGLDMAKMIVDEYFDAEYEGKDGGRHAERVAYIMSLEEE